MNWKKKFKFVFITLAFAVLIFIVLTNIFKMTQVTEKDLQTYAQGLAYLNKKDLQNAYFNFANVSKNSAIYEIALLRQALCADELKDSETAIKKYRIFLEKYPESVFSPKASYALGQNYFKVGDYSKAEKFFNNLRKDFKDSEYSIAANYYLGLIYKEKALAKVKDEPVALFANNTEKDVLSLKEKSKEFFSQYLKDSPNGRYADVCVKELIALGIPLSESDYFYIGKSYFKNGFYETAKAYFNKSSIKYSWAYISEIYRKQSDFSSYRSSFENNYAMYSEYIDDDDLKQFLENYAANYRAGVKQGWLKLLSVAEENDAKGTDYILYRLLKHADKYERVRIYEKIYSEYPSGYYASDAVANLFWTAYKNQEYKKAYNLGLIHSKDYQNTIAAPKILFWMGKLLEKKGKRSEARAYFQRILDHYPDDYYAFRASKHLNFNPNNGWKTKSSRKLSEKMQDIPFPAKHSSVSVDNTALFNAIFQLNDYSLLSEIDNGNKALQSWLLYKDGKFATSGAMARDYIASLPERPDFSDNIYKLAYQLHHQDLINKYTREYRLDSYLIAALIREESYYNAYAGSSVGARGLMQLMPATASYIAQRNGISYSGVESLSIPEVNIHLGCAYFDYAKEKLHEDDLLAVASYNGGPNAVQYWKDNLEYRNFDEFIENIPYPETRDYVKKVYRSYWVYLNIY